MILAAIEPGNRNPKLGTPARITEERARLGSRTCAIRCGLVETHGRKSTRFGAFEVRR